MWKDENVLLFKKKNKIIIASTPTNPIVIIITNNASVSNILLRQERLISFEGVWSLPGCLNSKILCLSNCQITKWTLTWHTEKAPERNSEINFWKISGEWKFVNVFLFHFWYNIGVHRNWNKKLTFKLNLNFKCALIKMGKLLEIFSE